MRVDILPAVFVAGILSVTGGAWTGYKLSAVARASSHSEGLVSPPMDAAQPQIEVGELSDGILRVHPTVVRATRPVFGSVVPEVKFFDFKHSVCDSAESVHGQVVRCVKPSR